MSGRKFVRYLVMRCERGLRNLFNKASGHGIPSQNFYSKNEVVDNAGAVYDGRGKGKR